MSQSPNSGDAPTQTQPYGTAHMANVMSAVKSLQHPTQIGPYIVRELVGEGGMGMVYKAEQREPIRRMVAIKIIKLGMDTREVIARFESERQALALMNHPNVAKVLDAGATDTGRPYFVMEFVPGEPITEFADRHKLTVRARLELFINACEAVNHAHQKAIIHRDLKPSNILVMLEDGAPRVKVIDFGVAKAVSRRLTEKTLFTEAGQLVGTPEYMAPEQADLDARLDIDTRSDVYSLGVILYELLSGALPFDGKTLRGAGFNEIQRIIREVDPPRPSTRLSSLGNSALEIAARRQVPLESLEKQLKRELEWIPLKAMRKDRQHRYAAVTELMDDIRNYLSNRPLRAGPESKAYRAKKFIRRNKRGVATSIAMLVLLVAGIVTTTWQSIRATRAEHATRAALEQVQQQKKQVEEAGAGLAAVNQFLTQDLLNSASPDIARGEEITIKQALDRAAESIDSKFADQPLIAATVHVTLAITYDALGRADLGLPHARQALATRQRLLGKDAEASIVAQSTMVQMLDSMGKLDDAEKLARETADRSRRVFGPDNAHTIVANSDLARILSAQGNNSQAEILCRAAMESSRRVYGPDHEESLTAINNFAGLLQAMRRDAEAEPLFREVADAATKSQGLDSPVTIIAMSNLSLTLIRQHKLAQAEPIILTAYEHGRRVFGPEHQHTMQLMRNLGTLYQEQKRFDEAEKLYTEAMRICRRVHGDDYPGTLAAMNNLASLLADRGKMDESIALYKEVLAGCRRTFSDNHPYVLLSLGNLGEKLYIRGRFEEAEPIFAEAYRKALQSELDPERTAACVARWGPCLVKLGRFSEAEAPLREARRRILAAKLTNNELLIDVLESLAIVCEKLNRAQEAAQLRAETAALPTTQPG